MLDASSVDRLSQMYGNPIFDSLAGVSIAGLLGVMGIVLTEVKRFIFCACRILHAALSCNMIMLIASYRGLFAFRVPRC